MMKKVRGRGGKMIGEEFAVRKRSAESIWASSKFLPRPNDYTRAPYARTVFSPVPLLQHHGHDCFCLHLPFSSSSCEFSNSQFPPFLVLSEYKLDPLPFLSNCRPFPLMRLVRSSGSYIHLPARTSLMSISAYEPLVFLFLLCYMTLSLSLPIYLSASRSVSLSFGLTFSLFHSRCI